MNEGKNLIGEKKKKKEKYGHSQLHLHSNVLGLV